MKKKINRKLEITIYKKWLTKKASLLELSKEFKIGVTSISEIISKNLKND